MLTSIKNAWSKFESWVAGWFPGFKTELVTALGAVGSAAAYFQDYLEGLTGLPNNVVSGTTLSIFTFVCFTLAFWLRGIGDRAGLVKLP